MNVFRVSKLGVVTALAVLGASVGWDRSAFAQEAPAEEGVQVLTRGPVHEAFAQTVTFNPEPGIVVPKAPPGAIEELPPDQRPAGDNVAWIPGYSAWDDDRSDFLWVSGIWRALPPGRQWVPGYWNQAGQNYQWTSGYWADAKLSENEYLPEPPDTVEAGPNIAAPSENHLWTPGCWVWNENRYAWRPGYWVVAQQNWVWVPAQYLWCPRGYVFVDGYYDYSVARRGVLFAPVYFNQNVYARQGYTYSPTMAISLAVFGNQLFLRPNYNHYYFGDYYASNYSRGGFYPWFSFNSGGRGYDPFYAHQRWHHRNDREWQQRVEADFQYRHDNEDARPPRTLAAQQTLLKSGNITNVNNNVNNIVVATSLDQLAQNKDAPVRLQAVNSEEKQTLAKHGNDMRQFRSERQKLEATPAAAATVGKSSPDFKPAKVKLPKSPILAKSADQLDQDHAPPKRHDAPAPDLKVEPKARQATVKGEPPKGKPTTIKAGKPELPQGKPRETADEPKGAPKSAPKAEPKPERPRGEPKPAPKVEPKREPKREPKVEPRVEPKPAPRVEPKPERPRVEPKPAPKVEPKREPPQDKPRAKDQPKGDDKEKKPK